MSPRLSISDLLIKRLQALPDGTEGHLFGINDHQSILLLTLSLSTNEDNDVQGGKTVIQDISPNLPGGIDHCGLFKISSSHNSLITNKLNENSMSNDNGFQVVLMVDDKTNKVTAFFSKNDELKQTDFKTVDHKDVQNNLVNLRLSAMIPMRFDLDFPHVETALNEFEKNILSGNLAFQFENKEIYILGNCDDNINGIAAKSSLKDLLNALNMSKNESETKNIIINVHMYTCKTNQDDIPPTAPYIKYLKKEFKHADIQFSIDALVTAPKTAAVTQLHRLLVSGTHRNFILNKNNFLQQLQKGKIFDVSTPTTYHFFPPCLGHFLTIVYSAKQNMDELRIIRESFHKVMSLPMDRPLFRQANSYDFSSEKNSGSNLLLNPHEKVGKSGVVDGEPFFVQGTYAYHHYMQDSFDDNGWGCAYRSLQTIISWFRYQGYTNMVVPSHKEIQQCLVSIGDKPGSFVGSRQWIGSTEVSFVLETMLGVTSRIVNVSSGEEMTMKGGELSHHFKTQGTPIMIGGGVLAHTILGVDYNKNTGDIKFLILDPHYTGAEDLGLIVKKGWCGWKGPEFWKKDAFYNMCLPLKPKCV